MSTYLSSMNGHESQVIMRICIFKICSTLPGQKWASFQSFLSANSHRALQKDICQISNQSILLHLINTQLPNRLW